MTAITKVSPSQSSLELQPGAQKLPALTAGEDLDALDACYIKNDGKIYKSSGALTGLTPPDAPALTTATSGGTVAAGLYEARVTYVNATGETVASDTSIIATTGSTSTITVASPAAAGSGGAAATKYKVYISAAGGGPLKLQNGAGTNIASNFTLTAPPVTNTATAPTTDTSGSTAASKVRGFAPTSVKATEPVSLVYSLNVRYAASGLTPGAPVYLSGSTAGALDDAPSALGTGPVGFVIDSTRIHLHQSRY